METPNEFEHKKSTQKAFSKSNQDLENIRSRRSNFLPLVLLSLPIIFIVIALTKVLASEEYNPVLEKETISWKNEPLSIDTSFSDTAR